MNLAVVGITDVRSELQIHANLARQRMSESAELSSWSQYLVGFQEPHHLAVFTLQ